MALTERDKQRMEMYNALPPELQQRAGELGSGASYIVTKMKAIEEDWSEELIQRKFSQKTISETYGELQQELLRIVEMTKEEGKPLYEYMKFTFSESLPFNEARKKSDPIEYHTGVSKKTITYVGVGLVALAIGGFVLWKLKTSKKK